MRHKKKVKKLSRKKEHREALLKNLCKSIITYYAIKTTRIKANALASVISRLITWGKRNDLHSRRLAYSYLQSHQLVKKLFDEIAPRFVNFNGGYTRIVRLGRRKGDGAELALIELIGFEEERKKKIEELEARRKEKESKELSGGM